MFIKFFLIQKSKSSTNLNHKQRKQEQATTDKSTTISDCLGKNRSCVIYPWDSLSGEEGGGGGSFPRGNYVGDKSSERQFFSGAISRGILSGGNYLWGNCLEGIVRRQFCRGNYTRGQSSGGQFSSGAIIQAPNLTQPKI